MIVKTLDQLDFSAPPGKRLVVLGDPVAHSLSPAMHNAALSEMAKSFPEMGSWEYTAVHVPAEDLESALKILHRAGVLGINLTIPHKVKVLDLVTEIDPGAKRMGAVNTLIRTSEGFRGANTDGFGIIKALDEALGCRVEQSDFWLFGAGGAARGILVAALEAGASRVTVVNRSSDRLDAFQEAINQQEIHGLNHVRFCTQLKNPLDQDPESILVNATSLGLRTDDPNPIDRRMLAPGCFVYDTTYGCTNRLSRDCREIGVAYSDGLSMLVWQGVRSLEIWTGKPVSASHMRAAAEHELKNRKDHE